MILEKNLFCFGLGFTTTTFGKQLIEEGWSVVGTTRNPVKARDLQNQGFKPLLISKNADELQADIVAVEKALSDASHILISVPPDRDNYQGDPVLKDFETALLQHAAHIKWIGYLSTIGVYGDHDGAWVDESSQLAPVTSRSANRVEAEKEWQAFGEQNDIPVQLFRLPGIYGPGRNQLVSLKKGKSRRLIKQGQVFNRMHVEDIAQTLGLALATPSPVSSIYNLSDDEPSPPQDVVTYGAQLLNIDPPPIVKFEEIELSPMAMSFYGECKRVKNDKIKSDLGVRLKYPTYREGLKALLATLD